VVHGRAGCLTDGINNEQYGILLEYDPYKKPYALPVDGSSSVQRFLQMA
jgi:hypothetical protein